MMAPAQMHVQHMCRAHVHHASALVCCSCCLTLADRTLLLSTGQQGLSRPLAELAVSAGDELQLRHTCAGHDMKSYSSNGIVVRLADASEEVTVEMRSSKVSATLRRL